LCGGPVSARLLSLHTLNYRVRFTQSARRHMRGLVDPRMAPCAIALLLMVTGCTGGTSPGSYRSYALQGVGAAGSLPAVIDADATSQTELTGGELVLGDGGAFVRHLSLRQTRNGTTTTTTQDAAGHYSRIGTIVTLHYDEGVTETFAVSDAGRTLTLTASHTSGPAIGRLLHYVYGAIVPA
jgi:hypothetical protein